LAAIVPSINQVVALAGKHSLTVKICNRRYNFMCDYVSIKFSSFGNSFTFFEVSITTVTSLFILMSKQQRFIRMIGPLSIVTVVTDDEEQKGFGLARKSREKLKKTCTIVYLTLIYKRDKAIRIRVA
jgi:hypothetical protein